MKKVIIVLLCMVGMTALAQKGERHHRSAMNNMTPEQNATLETKKMTLALDLTDTQQKQIQTLNLQKAKTRKEVKKERKALKENGESKKITSEERYAMKNERLDKMVAHKAEMKEILSQVQYDRWEKMVQRKHKQRKGRWLKHRSRK